MADTLKSVNDQLATTLDFTVAHEVAHQYFAGIVGNDSHRFPSLDEPIAQYAAGLAIEDRHGKDKAVRAMDANVKINYAMYRMLGGADKPVLRDTQSFATPIEYAALVYGKAPYVYVELRTKLGDEKLHGAIKAAVDEHRFSLVTTDQWITSLEKNAGGPSSGVRAAFTRWLRQTHADDDLGVDASGDFVLDTMLPPGLAGQLGGAGGMFDLRAMIKSMLGAGSP
jgi:aminopeptidase N